MINVQVKEFNIKIDGEEYTFRLDFNALRKYEERYENAIELFNEFLQGHNQYSNIIKILSCACVEKDWEEEELASSLSFDFNTMTLMDEITFALVEGLLDPDGGAEKNK